MKCALASTVVIPSNQTRVVDGMLSKQIADSCTLGLIQPWSQSVLPDGVSIMPTFVALDQGLDCFFLFRYAI